MTSAPLNYLPPRCRVYWVLVPLQCSSHMGFCVQQLASPDPEPMKHQRCEVMRNCFSIVVLQEGKWCYKFIPPSIHLVKQRDHVERNDNLQSRWAHESMKQEAHKHAAQLKTVNYKTCRGNFAKVLFPNMVVDFVGRAATDRFTVPGNDVAEEQLWDDVWRESSLLYQNHSNKYLYKQVNDSKVYVIDLKSYDTTACLVFKSQ